MSCSVISHFSLTLCAAWEHFRTHFSLTQALCRLGDNNITKPLLGTGLEKKILKLLKDPARVARSQQLAAARQTPNAASAAVPLTVSCHTYSPRALAQCGSMCLPCTQPGVAAAHRGCASPSKGSRGCGSQPTATAAAQICRWGQRSGADASSEPTAAATAQSCRRGTHTMQSLLFSFFLHAVMKSISVFF